MLEVAKRNNPAKSQLEKILYDLVTRDDDFFKRFGLKGKSKRFKIFLKTRKFADILVAVRAVNRGNKWPQLLIDWQKWDGISGETPQPPMPQPPLPQEKKRREVRCWWVEHDN